MRARIPWSWAESLAGLRPDAQQAFRVEQIVIGMVRDRCRDLDIHEGSELRCRGRNPEHVHLELSEGEVRDLEVPYAWFVQVQPVEVFTTPVGRTKETKKEDLLRYRREIEDG